MHLESFPQTQKYVESKKITTKVQVFSMNMKIWGVISRWCVGSIKTRVVIEQSKSRQFIISGKETAVKFISKEWILIMSLQIFKEMNKFKVTDISNLHNSIGEEQRASNHKVTGLNPVLAKPFSSDDDKFICDQKITS